MSSPLLTLPGAVAAEGIDAGVAAHYGSFNVEQRSLAAGEGFVDLSHRDVLQATGPDRLTWLHSLTTQHLEQLPANTWTGVLVLSPKGHVEHAFYGYDTGGVDDPDGTFLAHAEPGQGAALVEFLDRMRFMMRVEVTEVTAEYAVTWRPAKAAGTAVAPEESPYGGYELVPRAELEAYAAAAGPAAGLWAFEALRIARGEPRLGLDTDERTIPNEAGWVGPAVHLEKGCYRGQETVARIHTLGRPPRRLTLLHLDGSENRLPERGAELRASTGSTGEGKVVGFVGTSARHHDLGPIALAMVKRNVSLDAVLSADDLPAGQEMLVDPEVGLHVKPRLR